jgi:type II secretory pathway component PulF
MAMVYPALMVMVGIGTIVFMLTFVLPKLMNIYSTMGQALPLPTRILISASTFMQTKGWILGVAIIAVIGFIKRYSSTPSGRYALSVFVLRLPVAGGIILKAELSRFSRTMEMLLRSGLPIMRAISITLPVLGNEFLKQKLGASLKALEQGGSFTSCLKNVPFIPPFMMNLVSVGEESGRIDDALREVADSYEQDTDDSLHVANNLLEPVMILSMGIVVGFIVMAMLLPIFEMNVMAR